MPSRIELPTAFTTITKVVITSTWQSHLAIDFAKVLTREFQKRARQIGLQEDIHIVVEAHHASIEISVDVDNLPAIQKAFHDAIEFCLSNR